MKFKLVESTFDRKGLLPLTEANIRRIAKGHDKDGFAVLSASRETNKHVADDVENPERKNPNERNDKQTKLMKQLINSKGYTYIPIYGGYHEEGTNNSQLEKSFIVYPYKRNNELVDWEQFENDMYDIANNNVGAFNQDSIMFKRPNKVPMYVNPRTREDDFEPGSDVVYNDTDQTYFSAIKKWKDTSLNRKNKDFKNGKPQRFTFTEAYIEQQPMTIGGSRVRSGQGELVVYGFCGEKE